MRYGSFVLVVTLAGSLTGQQATDPMRHTFLQRVDDYVALHRRLEGPLPPEVVTADVEALFAPRRALAAAIRTARPNAAQGEIFTPAVARYFRIVVAEALREGAIEDMLGIVEEENVVKMTPRVNADYPAGASIPLMPTSLLAALPPLPPELEYRFLGRDLILWDVHAGLIVDFVPAAIPATT